MSFRILYLSVGLVSGAVFGVYLSQGYEVPKMLNLARVVTQEAGKVVDNIDKVEEIADKLKGYQSEKSKESEKPNK